jgi:tryptophan 2,3-dioxygenase
MKDTQFNYQDHLQLDKILNAQVPVSDHPEEIFFIIVHQAYELWFKTLILDLERIIARLENDELAEATWLLQRCGRIMEVADKQLDVLEMMTAADFQEFRPYLKEASGLQSRQFRKIEVLGGLGDTVGETYAKRVEVQWPGLISEVPLNLHQVFLDTIERHGLDLLEIYQERWQNFQLFTLCEACLEFDTRFLTWRQNHIKMVERLIGNRAKGTGGTYGTRYLTATTQYRFFPELWDIRNTLTETSGGQVYK